MGNAYSSWVLPVEFDMRKHLWNEVAVLKSEVVIGAGGTLLPSLLQKVLL